MKIIIRILQNIRDYSRVKSSTIYFQTVDEIKSNQIQINNQPNWARAIDLNYFLLNLNCFLRRNTNKNPFCCEISYSIQFEKKAFCVCRYFCCFVNVCLYLMQPSVQRTQTVKKIFQQRNFCIFFISSPLYLNKRRPNPDIFTKPPLELHGSTASALTSML